MRKYLVGGIALVALSIVSLGLAAGLPSTGGDGRSTVASPETSTASARCSKAEATAIVKRLRLGYADYLPNPVYQVICGAFMGPRSQTMVALLASGGASNPFGGWAVFRSVGGAWQLVMERTGGGRITAAGPDIRETVSILREGDSRCCPSGGTKARLWRWNGTRFVAGPWKLRKESATTAGALRASFYSPSRNLSCGMHDESAAALVSCQSIDRPHAVTMGLDGRLKICRGIRNCVYPNPGVADIPKLVLGYGRQITVGRLRCLSLQTGLKCTVIQSGKGFLISRDGVSRVGS